MSAESIATEVATAQGWSDTTVLDLALTYIDRQGANDAFADYLRGIAEEENSDNGDGYDLDDEDDEDDEDGDEGEDFGPYDWTCTYCGSALNENNFDETGSRKCYSDDHAEHLDEGDGTEFEDESHG